MERQSRPIPRSRLAQQKRFWLVLHPPSPPPFRACTGEADTVVARTEIATGMMDLASMLTIEILVGLLRLRLKLGIDRCARLA